MKKILPLILILCAIGAWGMILIRNQGTPKEYTEYLENAQTAFEEEYYVETLNWIQMAGELSEDPLNYDVLIMKRDAYYALGDMDSYAAQCKALIQQYPDNEENYVALVTYYKDTANYRLLYGCIDEYRSLFPDNQELVQIGTEYDSLYEYMHMGYYDVSYATRKLVNVQSLEYELEDEQQVVKRVLRSSQGNLTFDGGYRQIVVSADGASCFVQKQDGEWIRVNPSNQLLARNQSRSFETIEKLSEEGLAVALLDGSYHFINSEMKVADQTWQEAGNFSEGYNAVCNNGKWALVTSDNWQDVQEYPYQAIALNSMRYCVQNGLCVVDDDSGYYILDTTNENQPVSDNRYEELKAFESSQPTAYRSGTKWGYVNRTGEIYIEAQYEDAQPFINGYAAVKQNGLWGYIDSNGAMVVEPQYQEALNMLPDGVAYVRNELGTWDYILLYKLYYTQES